MATQTSLGIIKPAVADPIDADLWGTQWNTNADTINTLIQTNIDAIANIAAAPTGGVIDFGGTAAPAGWVLCYGQAISRTTFSDLFTVIGTTYGTGDGSTTFNVPDLRGRVVAGQDDMGGVSANRLTGQSGGVDGDVLGGSGGGETHTLTTAELAAHTHTTNVDYSGPLSGGASGQHEFYERPGVTNVGSDNIASASAGSDTAHNNVQPTLILNKIIKT